MSKFKIFDVNSKQLIATYDKCYDNQRVKGLDTLYIKGEFYKPVDVGYNFDNNDFILMVQKKSNKFRYAYNDIQEIEEDNEIDCIIKKLQQHIAVYYPYSSWNIRDEELLNCYNFIVEENNPVKAIKFIREQHYDKITHDNIGLKEGKEFIDYLIDKIHYIKYKDND